MFLQRPPRCIPICSGTIAYHLPQQITAMQVDPIFKGVSDIAVKATYRMGISRVANTTLSFRTTKQFRVYPNSSTKFLDVLFGKTWKEEVYLALSIAPRTLAEQGYEFMANRKERWQNASVFRF